MSLAEPDVVLLKNKTVMSVSCLMLLGVVNSILYFAKFVGPYVAALHAADDDDSALAAMS